MEISLEFGDIRLTSYAGLELFGRYLRTRRFNHLVRDAFADLAGATSAWWRWCGCWSDRRRPAPAPRGLRRGRPRLPAVRERARGAYRAHVGRWLRDAHGHPLPGAQRGRRETVAAHAGAAHLDGRCGRRRGVDRVAGRTGRAGLQPAPTEGAQRLPDHGAPGRDDTHLAGQEPVGQRPRWEGRPAVLARPVAPAGGAAHRRGPAAVSHGWGVFSARCAAVAARPRRGLCHQSPVLSLVGSAGLHPGHPHLGPGGARRDRLRRAASGDAVADPRGRDHLSEEGPPPGHEELSARPV